MKHYFVINPRRNDIEHCWRCSCMFYSKGGNHPEFPHNWDTQEDCYLLSSIEEYLVFIFMGVVPFKKEKNIEELFKFEG